MTANIHTPKTFIAKGRDGWKAQSTIDLGNGRQLQISTSKTYSGALVSSALVGKVEGGFFSFMMYQDFQKRIIARKVRVTDKAVEAQHAEALGQLSEILAAVRIQYGDEITG